MGYLTEERETHLYYDPVERQWKAWTNMMYWRDRFIKRGWKLTDMSYCKGEEVDWTFTAPQNAVTIRNLNKVRKPLENEGLEDGEDLDDTFILDD